MCAENQIHKRVTAAQPLGDVGLLYHTSAQRNFHMPFFHFAGLERTDIAEHSVLCVFTDGTSVVQHEIRFVEIVREVESAGVQHPFHALPVGHVALTAVCMHKSERRRIEPSRKHRAHKRRIFLLFGGLLGGNKAFFQIVQTQNSFSFANGQNVTG